MEIKEKEIIQGTISVTRTCGRDQGHLGSVLLYPGLAQFQLEDFAKLMFDGVVISFYRASAYCC